MEASRGFWKPLGPQGASGACCGHEEGQSKTVKQRHPCKCSQLLAQHSKTKALPVPSSPRFPSSRTNYKRNHFAKGRDFMLVSASSVVFCFVFIGAPLIHSRAMAATVETSACAAAASVSEDEVSTASCESSSVASSPGTPVAKAKAMAAVGRPVVERSPNRH